MTQQNSKKKPSSKYLALSGAGFQMGIIICGFAWLGNHLDSRYESKTPWWTLGLCLLGVFIGLYIMIKGVMGLTNDKSNEK